MQYHINHIKSHHIILFNVMSFHLPSYHSTSYPEIIVSYPERTGRQCDALVVSWCLMVERADLQCRSCEFQPYMCHTENTIFEEDNGKSPLKFHVPKRYSEPREPPVHKSYPIISLHNVISA